MADSGQQQSAATTQHEFFSYRGDELRQAREASRRKRVCVIGGGIAGLVVAAYELSDTTGPPHEVVLVEGDQRLGGCIRTWRPRPDLSAEFGPMRIPLNHQGTLHYVDELQLRTGIFIQRNPRAFYRVDGLQRRIEEWSALRADLEKLHGESFVSNHPTNGSTAHKAMSELVQEAATDLDGKEVALLSMGRSATSARHSRRCRCGNT